VKRPRTVPIVGEQVKIRTAAGGQCKALVTQYSADRAVIDAPGGSVPGSWTLTLTLEVLTLEVLA
jgi:hypothetical protein